MGRLNNKDEKIRFRTKRTDVQMKIRLPKQLKDSLELEATKNGRSRVAEVLVRLGQSLKLKVTE